MSSNGASWGPRTQQFTFSTGREATLRQSLPLLLVARRVRGDKSLMAAMDKFGKGQEIDDPELALSLQDELVTAMWVHPKIVPLGQESNEDQTTLDDLDDIEIEETVTLALAEVRDMASFREDGVRTGSGSNGTGLGKPAKRAARPRKRQPGGVPA